MLNCVPGLFQWTGGEFNGTVINSNNLDDFWRGRRPAFRFDEQRRHCGPHRVRAAWRSARPGPGARFRKPLPPPCSCWNPPPGIYVSGCCTPVAFDNFGTFIKAGSSSDSVISVPFNNLGGVLEVETGTLTLANSGVSANANMYCAAGAALDITGGAQPDVVGPDEWLWRWHGALGRGHTQCQPFPGVEFTNDMFQWRAGTLAGWSPMSTW